MAFTGAGGADRGVSGRGRGDAGGVRVPLMWGAAAGNDGKANFGEPQLEGGVPAIEHGAPAALEWRAHAGAKACGRRR